MLARSDLPELQEPKSASLLVPLASDSNFLRPDNMATPLRPQLFENPKILGRYSNNSQVEVINDGSSSILRGRLFADPEGVPSFQVGKSFKFDDISSSGVRHASPTYATPLKGINWSSSRELSSRQLQEKHSDKIISESEQNGFLNQVRNRSPPYSRRVTANPISTPSGNYGLLKGSANNLRSNISGKRAQSEGDDRHWNVPVTDNVMDVSWSHGERSIEDGSGNVGLRWRSDEASDEEEPSPERRMEVAATPMRGSRRRFVRR